MPDWLIELITVLCIIVLVIGAVLGIHAFYAHMRNVQQLCIEHGYIEAFYYNTQNRYFCIGLDNGEWHIIPVEQLEVDE